MTLSINATFPLICSYSGNSLLTGLSPVGFSLDPPSTYPVRASKLATPGPPMTSLVGAPKSAPPGSPSTSPVGAPESGGPDPSMYPPLVVPPGAQSGAPTSTNKKNSSKIGVLIGATAGGLLAILGLRAVLSILIWYFCFRKKATKQEVSLSG